MGNEEASAEFYFIPFHRFADYSKRDGTSHSRRKIDARYYISVSAQLSYSFCHYNDLIIETDLRGSLTKCHKELTGCLRARNRETVE